MSSEDDEARKRRADGLRAAIRGAGSGKKPGRAPTPREITDEAARKAREDARDVAPGKDDSED